MPAAASKTKTKRTAYTAPALEKGLEILELLASLGRPVSTREIAARLGRSKGEIFRVVYVLVGRGYLKRDAASDELTLSDRLFELGIRTPRPRELVEIAVPAMEGLSNACGQSAHLVVLNKGETVVVATTAGRAEIVFSLRLGYRRPAVQATSGRLIIAFQNAERRARMIAEGLAVSRTRGDRKKLDAQLAAIAKRGFLVAQSRDVVGITDIGAPILDRAGHAIASVVVPYLNRHGETAQLEAIAKLVRDTCKEIGAGIR
jgi:DNA-binding IclR family transcriptional regulator